MRDPRRRWLVAAALALATTVVAVSGAGAQVSPPSANALGTELVDAQRAHLWRVAGWGGGSLIAGLGLIAGTTAGAQPAWRGVGIQAAAWGAINLGIVTWAFLAGIDPAAETLAGAIAAEDAYGNILLVNLGLNVGYMAVGATLAIAASHGIARARTVRGHGLGVIVQGLGLLVLDGIAYAGSRGRMGQLQGLAERMGTGPVPGAVDVTLLSIGL